MVIYFIHVYIFTLTYVLLRTQVYYIYYLFYFDIARTHFVDKKRIQNTENSEKQKSEMKQEIGTKREVNKDKTNYNMTNYRRSPPKVFLGKGVPKIWAKFTGEHTCGSLISTELLWDFIELTLQHGCSPGNLLKNFRTPLSKNTSGVLFCGYHHNSQYY